MKDAFGREITYLRVSVTDKCNLRCRYCMPETGVARKSHSQMMTQEETLRAIQAAAALGISKIRITGGEPLVKRGIVPLCAAAAATPGVKEVCLTTNGVLLPAFAKQLRQAGVQRVNISLDTLNPEKYARITRLGDLRDAIAGIEAALAAGFLKVKVNAVLIGGFNDDEIEDLASLTLRYPVDMRFIELMPMQGSREFGKEAYVPGSQVLARLPDALPIPGDGGVAQLYRLPRAFGNLGIISPLYDHFCGRCNRLRLTADGKLKPCLHSGDEISIRGLTTAQMQEKIMEVIRMKPACHGELSSQHLSQAGRSMHQIGG